MSPGTVGLLFEDGAIYTLDAGRPQADALAVSGDRIIAVGRRDELRAAYPGWRRRSLEGRAVLPAFTDGHIHLAAYGLSLSSINLRDCRSLREAVDRVAAAAARARPGEWIRGGRWDKNLWPEGRFPRREDLDPVTADRPAALSSKDGHTMWVNSAALHRAGIDAATPDPPGGRIARDPRTGQPTGLLVEEAQAVMRAVAGRPAPEELDAAILQGAAALHRAGIAAVHVMEDAAVLAAVQRLRARGALALRVCMMLPEDGLEAAIRIGIQSGLGDAMIRIGGVKIFADGALGSQTASMLEPYEGDPENLGVTVRSRQQLRDVIGRAASAGIAAVVHAIGDRANRWVLDAIEAARAEEPALPGGRKLRHRIEHAQLIHPDDLPRFARLGVVASMQPIHCTQDRDIADRYWGRRSRYAYPWRSLIGSGAHLAFGSDAPVETADVMAGIHAAVTRTRREERGRGAWYAEEALTVEEAIRAYTVGPAYASGEEGSKGVLAPGRVADFVVLSRDPFSAPPEALGDIRAELTVVGGEVCYDASSGSNASDSSSSANAERSTG